MNTYKKIFNSTSRSVAIALSIILISVVIFFVYSLSKSDFINKKQEILNVFQKNTVVWVQTTVAATTYWQDNLDNTAKKISTSELYRLFAQDLSGASNINMLENDENSNEYELDMGALAEQLPIMRNVLRDFVQYNKLISARIVSAEGETLLSSFDSDPPISQSQIELSKQTIMRNKISFAPVQKTREGLILYYAVPLSPVINDNTPAIASLIIAKNISSSVEQTLSTTQLPNSNCVPMLLQKVGDDFILVSNTVGNELPTKKLKIEGSRLEFDERESFLSNKMVYSELVQVLDGDFWILLETPKATIQEEIDTLATSVTALGVALSLGICLFIALLWWIVIGRQRKANADKFQSLYNLINHQKSLLDGVNASLNMGLALVDNGGFILVGNEAFCEISNFKLDDENANLTTVFSGEIATKILLEVQKLEEFSQEGKKELIFEIEIPLNEKIALFRITLYAYQDENKVKSEGDSNIDGAVCIFQDITEFRRNRVEAQKRQRSVIEGLLKVVESVDPHLSGHSAMLQKLSVFMAQHLELDEYNTNIVDTAAYFSQIGKFFVPRDILLKEGKLTPDELAILHEAPTHAYNILNQIDFGLPIANVVYEMCENMDGTGYPQKLIAENIDSNAKILAVANTFCALTSPRSQRLAYTASQAIEEISSKPEKYDPKVVAALMQIAKSSEELKEIFQFKEKPKTFAS